MDIRTQKGLLIGVIVGLLLGAVNTVIAVESVTPQGNLDFRGEGAVIDLKNFSVRSPDDTLWTCIVSDAGVLSCS